MTSRHPSQSYWAGEHLIDYNDPFTTCFRSGELESISISNNDGDKWVGHIEMTHSDPNYGDFLHCKNCECDGNCETHEILFFGIDDDDDVEGDSQCLQGGPCTIDVTWTAGCPECVIPEQVNCRNSKFDKGNSQIK